MSEEPEPIPIRLPCPSCGELHIDKGKFATKPHHTHACQSCGMVWRPAVVHTVGVQFLPGYKDPPVIHILKHGYALCGFSNLVPALWPKGHKWVGWGLHHEHDIEKNATCPPCIEENTGSESSL